MSDAWQRANSNLTGFKNLLAGNSTMARFVFVIFVIIAFVVLLSVGSHIINYFVAPASPYVIDGLITATNPKIISMDPKIGTPVGRSKNQGDGLEFTWSVWINITNMGVGDTRYRHIFSKGDNANMSNDNGRMSPNNAPGLYIVPETNDLVVVMNTFETIDEELRIQSVPMNKWINVIIRVKGMNVDVYVNGALVRRKVLESVPRQNNGSVYACMNGGYNGYLSNLRYYDYALSPGDIISLVEKGPSLKISSLESNDLKNTPPYFSLRWYFSDL